MPTRQAPTLDDEIRALYQGPLGEFTPARQVLAKRLQKEGNASAATVKELRKPVPSAWAVNQLFAREARAMAAFAGAATRAAAKGAPPLRDALESIRLETTRLMRLGVEILTASEGAAGSQVVERLRQNLEALALDPAHEPVVARGWLDVDLAPPGFEVTAALQLAAQSGRGASSKPVPSARPAAAAPARKDEARKPSRASQQAAERAAEERRRRIARAEEALAGAEAQAVELRQAADEATQTAGRLAREAAAAQQLAERSRFAASDAKRRADGAAAEVQAARDALRRAQGS